MLQLDQKTIDRFWDNVNKTSNPNGCWIWKSGERMNFMINYKGYKAHRISWYIYNGEIPKNFTVSHKCHNKSCLNPSHLFLQSCSESLMKNKPTIQQTFWKRVVKGQPEECWIWKGTKLYNGYGVLYYKKFYLAHRLSYLITYNILPDSLCVLHKCDNRLCVNPNHLFLGTLKDNIADMVSKNRQAKGIKNGKHTHPEKTPRGNNHYCRLHPEQVPRGEKNGMAKLTKEQVIEIRKKYIPKKYSTIKLGIEYNVSSTTIERIVKLKSWAHV